MSWGSPEEEARRLRVDARWAKSRRLVRRSVLIVPANVPRFVDGAHRRGADAVMLDLEDSIPPDEKVNARAQLADGLAKVGRGGADVLVRINKPFGLAVWDLDAAVAPGVAGITFPKAESASEVAALDALIAEREAHRGIPPGGVKLGISIESARAVAQIDAILAASDRIVTVDVGAEDLTRDLEIEPTKGGDELFVARQLVVLAARRAGIQALGLATTLANYTDLDAFRASVVAARELGFRGGACIHPAQVGPLNELFSPPRERVERARRVLAAYDAAVAGGRASAALDGQMIDVPVAERARNLLERVAAIEAHEERKRAALERAGA